MNRHALLAGLSTLVTIAFFTANTATAAPALPTEAEEGSGTNSFSFTLNDVTQPTGTEDRHIHIAGMCTGTFSGPRVEAGGILSYGLHVRCTGSGFLPLKAKIRLQEEHFGGPYETRDEVEKHLPEGGFGFVRGEVVCNDDPAGHDYRIAGEIRAGSHWEPGLSEEVHLPCDV